MADSAKSSKKARKPRVDRSAKARERLIAAGVDIDDVDRSTDDRQPKPPSVALLGLRDGANTPLRNLGHEEVARHVAGGMPEREAWKLAGYSAGSYDYLKVTTHPVFVERVAELRLEFQRGNGISLAYLQERLLRLTTADATDYIEKLPGSSKFQVKDLLSLPPEVRACVSEVHFDKDGNMNFKLQDKTKAIADLLRSLAPTGDVNVNLAFGERLEQMNRRHREYLKTIDAEPSRPPMQSPAQPLPAQPPAARTIKEF
jgi:hypothetical protein